MLADLTYPVYSAYMNQNTMLHTIKRILVNLHKKEVWDLWQENSLISDSIEFLTMSGYTFFNFSSKIIVHSTSYTNCHYYKPSDTYFTFFYTNKCKCRKLKIKIPWKVSNPEGISYNLGETSGLWHWPALIGRAFYYGNHISYHNQNVYRTLVNWPI